jgi:hypothetical protein
MTATASSPLDPRWKDLLSLSARRAPELYEKPGDVGNVPHARALRTTLDGLGASAVFCVQHVPTVVILSVNDYDQTEVEALHAALWNQGLASLLVVIAEDIVRVFTLARVPSSRGEEFRTDCLVQALNTTADALALRNLIYSAESGRFWEDNPDYFKPEERVERVLLDNLSESHTMLQDSGLAADEAQALIVQAMFVAYLEDRGIIGAEYFKNASNARANTFESLLRTEDIQALERLFDTLRNDFNGDLFVATCSLEANTGCNRLTGTHLETLARFRSGTEEMRGQTGQYRLWRYNFKYIPVELISSVHDRFLRERGSANRRRQGAYYTPMFLADTVVSQIWDGLPQETKQSGCFLDPACGSGIFLVRLFQRLCEHRRAAGSGCGVPWDDLLEILSKLQGRDLDGDAIRVAIFSLYVALLEEADPPAIQELLEHGRVLPALRGRSLNHGDFFAVEPSAILVDVVVGNPPWSSRRDEQNSAIKWCRSEGLPAPGREQAWPFVWKAIRHLRENGIVAFLLPAMGFLHNHSRPAVDARKRLFRDTRVCTVINFADLRFQLFDKAVRSAALILMGRRQAASTPYRFEYLTPKADLNLKSRQMLTISDVDRCRLDSRTVAADPATFKKRLWLTEPEAKLFNYLSGLPPLSDVVVEFGNLSKTLKTLGPLENRWIIGNGFKPVKDQTRQRGPYQRKQSSVIAKTPYLPAEHFRIIAQTCGGLPPWKDAAVHREGFDLGFKGPRILVPSGIGSRHGGFRLRASYVKEPLTFQDAFRAIVVPPQDERRGMLLTGLLNSRLMLWYAFHGTSSFGAERPSVHQSELLRLPFPAPKDMPDRERSNSAAEALVAIIERQVQLAGQPLGPQPSERDVLKEIDVLAYEYFCLSDEERILIEDTVEHKIPAIQPRKNACPQIWRTSTRADRRGYAETLVKTLAGWFDGNSVIQARLVARNDDLAVLRLSLTAAPSRFEYSELSLAPVEEELARLVNHIHQPLPGNFRSMPDFRVFIGHDLFLVKLAEKRFWLRSAALADANSMALDLQTNIGRQHDARQVRA